MNHHFDYQANLMNAQQLTILEMKTRIFCFQVYYSYLYILFIYLLWLYVIVHFVISFEPNSTHKNLITEKSWLFATNVLLMKENTIMENLILGLYYIYSWPHNLLNFLFCFDLIQLQIMYIFKRYLGVDAK